MGEVYLARMEGPGGFEKRVVVKTIHSHLAGSPEFTSMFVQEAKLVARLAHKNIVQVIDFGEVQGSYFLVMEYVEGYNLKHIFQKLLEKQRLLPIELAIYIVAEIAAALDFAHRYRENPRAKGGIVHRDISPQNMLISLSGEVKLTDFGIAKGIELQQPEQQKMLRGKIAYMSPEQAAGQEVDQRSDIFSLGIVLYELLTGARLFHHRSDRTSLNLVRNGEIPALTDLDPELGADLAAILEKALSRDVATRYQNARDFSKALLAFSAKQGAFGQAMELSEFVQNLFRSDNQNMVGRPQPPGCQTFARDQDERITRAANATALAAVIPPPPVAPTAAPVRRRWQLGLLIALAAITLVATVFLVSQRTQPIELHGILTVECEVKEAEVLIDGELVGSLGNSHKMSLTNVEPGRRRITLRRSDFNQVERTIDLGIGEPATLTFTLEPVEPVLIVRTTRPNATVSLGDFRLGMAAAPCGAGCYSLVQIAPPRGRHLLRVQTDDNPEFLQWIHIKDEPLILDAPLAKFATSRMLILEDILPGSELRIDGKVHQQGTDLIPVVISLTVGHHVLEISKPGFQSEKRDVTIMSDQNLRLSISLKPAMFNPPKR